MRISATAFICILGALSGAWSFSAAAQDALSELDFAFGAAQAQDPVARPDPWRGFLGAGVVALDHPVADRQGFLLPLASVSYRDTLYLRPGQAGAWVLKSGDRRARLGIAVKTRGGYDPDEVDGLAGMEQRDTSIEAGVQGSWRTRPITVSLGFFTDVSDNSNGNSAQLGISHAFRLSARWSLVPSVGAEWLSDEVVDYYYGVRPAEATPGRPAHAGRSTTNLRAALMLHHRLASAWSLFAGASYTRLGSGITDSPIILHDGVAAFFVGGGWHF